MRRPGFLGLAAAAGLALAQNKQIDVVTATATQDTTPRVGIVLSSFKQGTDHDGTKIKGLDEPGLPDADLTSTQIDAARPPLHHCRGVRAMAASREIKVASGRVDHRMGRRVRRTELQEDDRRSHPSFSQGPFRNRRSEFC